MANAPFSFLPLGAIIQDFYVGDTNIVLGFPKQEQYVAYNTPFFGETIGRVANRVGGAKIKGLSGKDVKLFENDGNNSLHGGKEGWGKKIWEGPKLVGIRQIPGVEGLEGGESVQFTLRDPDGNEGYPGTLDISVIYTTGTQKTATGKVVNVLGIEYEAVLAGDDAEETVVNITNHSYFNLSKNPTIEGTVVSLATDSCLLLNPAKIPQVTPEGKAYPLTTIPSVRRDEEFTLGKSDPVIDHCFVVQNPEENLFLDTRDKPLKLHVSAHHPESKIHLEVLSTEPAFQFYTGDGTRVSEIKGADPAPKRGARSGFCVEPSRYVNAMNVPEWKGQVLLKKGEKYGSRVVYKGWSEE